MITAAEIKQQTSNDRLQEKRDKYERDIRNAAKKGRHYVLLHYVDCVDGDDHIVFEELQRQGFKIYTDRENIGGYLQDRAYYARW